MSIIHILSKDEIHRLSKTDREYLKRKIAERSALNELLGKPVNKRLLDELQCILDSKPLPRRKPGQFVRGQISRQSDGKRYPCRFRKMTEEEKIKYGVK